MIDFEGECNWCGKKEEKEWQGLSKQEVDSIMQKVFNKSDIEINNTKSCSVFEGYLAIEQALKEKNAV